MNCTYTCFGEKMVRVPVRAITASRDPPLPDLPRRVFLPTPRSQHCHGHPALATLTRAPPRPCPYKPHHSHLPQTPLLEWMVPALIGCLTRALQQHPTTPECTPTSPVSSATSPTFRPTSPKSTSTSMTPTRSEAKPAADHPSQRHRPYPSPPPTRMRPRSQTPTKGRTDASRSAEELLSPSTPRKTFNF